MIYLLCIILLLCLSAQMEITTMPASVVTRHHGLSTTAEVSNSNTTITDDSPPLVSNSTIEKFTAGNIAAVGE